MAKEHFRNHSTNSVRSKIHFANIYVVSYTSLLTIFRRNLFSILTGYSGVYFRKRKYYYNVGAKASLICKIICCTEEIPCESEHEPCFQFSRPSQILNNMHVPRHF
jgi:hypothetical protein